MRKQHIPLLGALLFGGMAAAYYARNRYWKKHFSFRDRVVLITGGSRGLGFVLARQLAEEGANIVLLARSEASLQRAKAELEDMGAAVLAISCDIRSQVEVDAAVTEAIDEFGGIDVVINNAGLIQVGPLDSMTMEDFDQAMGVHFYGPLHTTLAVLPHMRRAGEGRIVNICSIGGKIALPHLVPYTASKFALVGLSDALQAELRRENIFVTTICPGLMRTGSPANAGFKGKHKSEYAWFATADSLPVLSMSADRAARKILAACRRKARQVTISFPAKAAVLFHDLFPGTAAGIAATVNSALPDNSPDGGRELHTGWESQSRLAPSLLTHLSDRAAARNNEMP